MNKQKQLELNKERFDRLVRSEFLNISLEDVGKYNPLFDRPYKEDIDNPLLHLLKVMRNPDYFYLTCKYIFNMNVPPLQAVFLKELWTHAFPMLIGSRGGAKTSSLALYAMLRAFLQQGSRIAIVGSAFRQSKMVFTYCESIWYNAPVLRNICTSYPGWQGPRHQMDKYEMVIGDSTISAFPLGTGEKIRGQRANVIIADEFAFIPLEIYQTVVHGFGAVSLSPVENMQRRAQIRVLKKLGMWTNEYEHQERKRASANQSIVAGTAYYDFSGFANYWKQYKAIIESKGDPAAMAVIFGGEVPHGISWEDFCIIRIPVEMYPEGFMDEKNIARGKAMIATSIYQMEYSACKTHDTLIITNKGVKPISDVRVDDLVLTHKGRFRPVTKVIQRMYNGDIVQWKTYGYNQSQNTTPDHPFWVGENKWEPITQLDSNTKLANLVELSNQTHLDVRNIVTNFVQQEDLIYCKSSQNKGGGHTYEGKPKGRIPVTIPLDYNFGLIVGYYTAEGSIGANGRAVSFSLDGHVNKKLESYIQELVQAINNVFYISPKTYIKARNKISVTINNRLVAELLKYICPGVSHTKYIQPNILYSNPEFMKGFMVGYWNGDGHMSDIRTSVSANCVNQSLLSQIKTLLSFFHIGVGLYSKKKTQVSVFRGKICNSKQVYTLVINGNNARRFRSLFYNKGIEEIPKYDFWAKIKNNGKFTQFGIKSKKLVRYDGLVYNLEVDEDNSYSLLNATVHNCFIGDTNGFFPASLLHRCTVKEDEYLYFKATIKGNLSSKYVYGVDPASEASRFSIIVLELHENHRRIVYGWSTNREEHRQKLKSGSVKQKDFYQYCARKIRDLMKVFPCEAIALDVGGGGRTIAETLQDADRLEAGELPILEVMTNSPLNWTGKARETDDRHGLHIIELVDFGRADWVVEANHGMKKDLLDRILLFPQFDAVELAQSTVEDLKSHRGYDSLEDCVMEIHDLFDELTTIVHTQTPATHRDHWDTPEIRQPGSKKGVLRKDRYSALLMANMAARRLQRFETYIYHGISGGFAGQITSEQSSLRKGIPAYDGPPWFTQHANTYKNCGVVKREGV